MARPRKRHIQTHLVFRTWGGRRKRAGRKQVNERKSQPHRMREELSPNTVVHVTLRMADDVARLRRRDAYKAIRGAMTVVLSRTDFRIVHLSIQANHVHLIVEADSKHALARGMQAFQISAARRLNKAEREHRGNDRHGPVFPDRYWPEIITVPLQARHALSYVLKNASHCTLSGRRVEFPTCRAQTRLLQRAQRAVGYRRASFEDFVWDRPPLPWPGQIDFQVRYGPGVPEQLHS